MLCSRVDLSRLCAEQSVCLRQGLLVHQLSPSLPTEWRPDTIHDIEHAHSHDTLDDPSNGPCINNIYDDNWYTNLVISAWSHYHDDHHRHNDPCINHD